MSAHLQRAIDELMKQLVSLSALVENSVKQSIQALENKDSHLARTVIDADALIDKSEIDIEEECLKIFALHQPVAVDLRYLVAVMKINNDLERIGDLAQNIADHSLEILTGPVVKSPVDFGEMYAAVQVMLKKSLDCIVQLDVDVAYEILKADDKIDTMHAALTGQVLEAVKKDPDHAAVLIQYMHIVRHLERIADHTTNIAEDVIYLITGAIVRHGAGKNA